MTSSLDPLENQLLAALPEMELQRWLPDLEFVEMHLGDVLYEFQQHAWARLFPCYGHHFIAVRNGKRRIRGDRRGWQ
jgi:hypothetical protein